MSRVANRFFVVFMLLATAIALIPVLGVQTAYAGDEIVTSVSWTCDMDAVNLNGSRTEGEVQTSMRDSAIMLTAKGVSLSYYNNFLEYWDEDTNSFCGVGYGTKMVNVNRQYYLDFSFTVGEGYDWPAEVKTIGKTYSVRASDLGSISFYFNGVKCTDAYMQYNSAANSVSIDIPIHYAFSSATVVLSGSSFAYDGTAKMPSIVSCTLKDGAALNPTDYSVSYVDASSREVMPVNVGTYFVAVQGKGIYSGVVEQSFAIVKAKNPMTAKGKSPVVDYSELQKENQVITAKKAYNVKKRQGKATYKKANKVGGKKIVVNKKTGKITIKKGLAQGTYKVKVKITAAGNANYKKKAKTVTVTIKVKKIKSNTKLTTGSK